MVEHVLGGLAQVDDPFAERRRPDNVGHVLVVDRAGRVIVTALGQVIRVYRAARDAHDRQAGLRPPVPAEVAGHSHRPGWIARHRMNTAIGGAGADREDRRRLGRQPVQPFVGRHQLPGRRVVAETAPVALFLDRLVGDGPLDDEDERFKFAAVDEIADIGNGRRAGREDLREHHDRNGSLDVPPHVSYGSF